MTMSLYSHFSTQAIDQLIAAATTTFGAEFHQEIEQLLDLTVLKSLLRTISAAERQEVQAIIRADNSRLPLWLEERYPAARMSISESLTRILLSLTVE